MPKITAKSDSAIPLSSSSSNNTTISIISSESDDITSINLLNTLGIGPALLQQYIKLLNSLLRNNTLSISHLIRLLTELESDLEKRMINPYTTLISSTEKSNKNSNDEESTKSEAISKLFTLLTTAENISDASVKLWDAAYARVDLSVSELDKLLRFIDMIIKIQSNTIEENQTKLLQTRPTDTISSRTRHRNIDVPGQSSTSSSSRYNQGYGGSTSTTSLLSSNSKSKYSSTRLSRFDADYHNTPLRKPTKKRRRGGIGPESPLDVAIDPHEPTYCTCGQVAFGEMIACDNENCLIEWYHCQCVGVTPATRPKGKWYCPSCQDQIQNEG